MSTRSRIATFGAAGAAVVAGIVCAILFGGTVGQVLAFVLIAGGLVLATSLVFLEVGLSEDRERARERRRTTRAARPRGRLERMRGQRRHLK